MLTEKGRGLFTLLVALRQWGDAYFFEPDEAHAVLVDKATGGPVQTLELRSQEGRVLTPEDTMVIHPSAKASRRPPLGGRKRAAKTAGKR